MSRKREPWFRRDRNRWFVTVDGKQFPLPNTNPDDLPGAWAAFNDLLKRLDSKLSGPAPPKCGTVAELAPAYLGQLSASLKPVTVRKYRDALKCLAARFGSVPATELVATAVEADAAGRGWSDAHRANYLWAVQAFARWAGRPEFAVRRPPKPSRGADAVIPDPVFAAVLRETTGDFHQYLRFLWLTGCRPAEAAGVTGAGVDWAAGCVRVREHKTAHRGHARTLFLGPEAVAVLREQAAAHRDGGFLFRGQRGERLTARAIVGRMIRLSEKVGRPVIAYGFRHTFATRALAAGLPDTHVAALLGQRSTAMIHKHYSHLGQQANVLRDAAAKAERPGPSPGPQSAAG